MTRKPREPVIFVRMFMGTTGAIAMVAGLYLLGIAVWRIGNPAPAPIPVPRALNVTFTLAFVLSVFLIGVCWIMVALSRRLWESS